jgi:hypothetical protein
MKNMNNNILISSWFNLQSSVPSSYVQPSKSRPDNIFVLSAKKIPVVDLGGHVHAETLTNILRASEEYGFFQICTFKDFICLQNCTINFFNYNLKY